MSRVRRLLRVSLTVTDLSRAARFYEEALGFEAGPERDANVELCALLGATRGRTRLLRLGAQNIELAQFAPPGPLYPSDCTAADLIFQHFAVVTSSMREAYDRVRASSPIVISRNGPVRLPARSGGVTAFKFRDPDGHPLELIEFPRPQPPGIDHSAISVADTDRSIAFYEALGLRAASRQINMGSEQEALDGLDGATATVVGLVPAIPTPHLELLCYLRPRGRPTAVLPPNAVAASRLVMETDGAIPETATSCGRRGSILTHDPDGHALLMS
jgi:catechol 2,3-dioxygenase-like lactoylglutathione lyase family enzyme